jgi:hypothetical protein
MDYYSKFLKYKTKYYDLKNKMDGGDFETDRILIGVFPNDQNSFLRRAQVFQPNYQQNNFHITLLDMFVNKSHQLYEKFTNSLMVPDWNFSFSTKPGPLVYELLGTFVVKKYQIDDIEKYNRFCKKIINNIFEKIGTPSSVSKIPGKSYSSVYYIYNGKPLFGFPEYLVNDDATLKPFKSHISIYKFLEQSLKSARPNGNKVYVPINRHILQKHSDNTLQYRSFNYPVSSQDETILYSNLNKHIREKIIVSDFNGLPNLPYTIDKTNSCLKIITN